MATITIYICDRCKKEHKEYPSGWSYFRDFGTDFSFSLCYECKELLRKFLRNA